MSYSPIWRINLHRNIQDTMYNSPTDLLEYLYEV